MARILITDDSGMMRRNLSIILEEAGHEIVAEASSGKQAYMEYDKHHPDIVTMDIEMPEMNGIETCKMILEHFPKANIIMVSSVDQKHLVIEAIKSGATNYVLKPFSEEKVLSAINDILRKNRIAIPIAKRKNL